MRLGNEAPHRSKSPRVEASALKASASRSRAGSHRGSESNGSLSPYKNASSLPTRKVPSGPFYGHDRGELVRILIQTLLDMGYSTAASSLAKESGYEMEGPSVTALRSAILQGNWAAAEALLFGPAPSEGGVLFGLDGQDAHGRSSAKPAKSCQAGGRCPSLVLVEGADKSELLFRLRQQKYLELLEQRDLTKALVVLRQELAPLQHSTERLHSLSR